MENFSLNLLIVDHYNSLISEIENQAEYVLLNSSESHSLLGDIEIAGLYKVRNRFIEELMRLESSNISNLYHISGKINIRLGEIKQKSSRVFELDYLNEIKRELFQNKCCLFIKSDQFSPRLLKYIRASASGASSTDKQNSLRLGVLLIFNWFLSDEQIRNFKKFLSDPRSFDTLSEDLLLFDLVLDCIINSTTHIIEIVDRDLYDQTHLSIRNKSLIRFNAIDAHAFVKFRHLKSFGVTFQHGKPDTNNIGVNGGGSSTASSVFHDDDGIDSFDESTNDELASNDSSVRHNSIHRHKHPVTTSSVGTHVQIDQINKKLFECKTNVNLARVEELTLSLNTIRIVDTNSFVSFDRLRKLNLSFNKLRDLSETKVFKGLVNLTDLDLSMNSIVKLNKEVFACLKNLETLNLAANFIQSIDKKAFSGLDKLETLNLRNNCIKFTAHSPVKASPFACLKSLKSLNLAENEIEHVSRSLFKGLAHLRDLVLYKNRIRSLEDNCFNMSSVDSEFKTSLTRLDLSANQIRKLEKNMFNGMSQLEELLLNSNMIGSIDELCFQDLKQLRHLDMSCNEIESVTKDMFLGLSQLSYLIMSNNSVCDLEANCFQELESLKLLDISYNRLDSLNKTNFQNLKNLEELMIRVNLIKSLPGGTFANLTGVKKLDMSFNKIEKLDKNVFSGLINLEELKLTGNALKLVDEQAFGDLYKLKLLDLSLNNQLEFNAKSVFDSLTSLEELNLVPLTKLDTRLFENLLKLNYLHFYRYKIQIIDRAKFFKAINEDFENVESNESNTNDKCFDYEIVDYYVWAESKLK